MKEIQRLSHHDQLCSDRFPPLKATLLLTVERLPTYAPELNPGDESAICGRVKALDPALGEAAPPLAERRRAERRGGGRARGRHQGAGVGALGAGFAQRRPETPRGGDLLISPRRVKV